MNLDGCPGCNSSQQQKQKEHDARYKAAKLQAIDEQRYYVIYEDDEGRAQIMEGQAARAAGVRVVQYVSHVPDSNNG